MSHIHIVGGGLAGSEAAWQAASRGVSVVIHEMRPVKATEVHHTDKLAELVCSNSLRSDKLDNAVGLLKEEMRRLGSLVMRIADRERVPAGAALAVDRERFAEGITEALTTHPLIRVVREEVREIPAHSLESPVILATGPLTSEALSSQVASLVGQAHLYFYDAVSPIVLADSIDRTKVFRASRWGRSLTGAGTDAGPGDASDDADASAAAGPTCAVDEGEGDYLNCPFDEPQYQVFLDALLHAERAVVHDFEKEKFFEGCLPIEVMAHRGPDTLRFGPMKPVGLTDPRTGRSAYAIVQLRQDNLAAEHYSMVGFQTQLKFGEQARVFRLIPGLEQAEFVRYGLVHRNTYINGPSVLDATWEVRGRSGLFVAGQMSGVEGYVESAASGLLAGINAAAVATGRERWTPSRETAIGALAYYASHADARHYQPSNITFGIMSPLVQMDRRLRRDRRARNEALSARALAEIDRRRAEGRLNEIVREFLSFLRLNRNASPHTVLAYDTDLSQLVAFMSGHCQKPRADLLPADLTRPVIRAFLADLFKHGDSRATAARKLAAVRTFLRYLRREGADRQRPRPARGDAETRAEDPAPPGHRRDDAAARDARSLVPARSTRPSDPRAAVRVGAPVERAGAAAGPGRREPGRARMVRVMGKGRKERIVPFNRSAATAVRSWLPDRERTPAAAGGAAGGGSTAPTAAAVAVTRGQSRGAVARASGATRPSRRCS